MNNILNRKLNIDNIAIFALGLFIISLFALYEYRHFFEIICLLILLFYSMKKGKGITYFTVWSIIFLVIGLLSVLYSENPSHSLLMSRKLLELAVISYFLIAFIDSSSKLYFLQKIFIIAGMFMIIRLLATFPISDWGTARLGDDMLNANTIGMYLSISSVFALEVSIKEQKRKYLLLLPAFFIVILLTGSRKALLMFISGVSAVYYFNSKKLSKKALALIFSIILVCIGYFLIMNIPDLYHIIGVRFERLASVITGQGTLDNSARVRFEMIDKGLSLFKMKPLFGYGISTYRYVSGFGMYAHNNYIELLVGIGLVGTIAYYSMYFYLLVYIIKNLKKFDRKSFLVILILLIIMEYGFVSYYSEVYHILIASIFICSRLTKIEGKDSVENHKQFNLKKNK